MIVPVICPRCGGSRIARILSENSVPWRHKEPVQRGQAVLASNERPANAPDWTCLACEPAWETVHRLAIERETLFDKTVDAVAEHDFDEAHRLKGLRVPIEVRQKQLIAELCAEPVRSVD